MTLKLIKSRSLPDRQDEPSCSPVAATSKQAKAEPELRQNGQVPSRRCLRSSGVGVTDGQPVCCPGDQDVEVVPAPMQIIQQSLQYLEAHYQQGITLKDWAASLQISEARLELSFAEVRGVTPLQALQDYRLNRLFTTLSEQPAQGLSAAIRMCGLGPSTDVIPLFEQTFGIEIGQFLLTCRRAVNDRAFRRQHPGAETLVLPLH